jgi:hypothetical protein
VKKCLQPKNIESGVKIVHAVDEKNVFNGKKRLKCVQTV